MGKARFCLRCTPLFCLRAAIVLAAAAVLTITAGRGTSVAGAIDLTGVTCMDLYLDGVPLEAKGDPHGPEDPRTGKILSRIEPSATQPGGWDITSVAYNGPGALIPTKPPSAETCEVKQDGNSLNNSVPFQQVDANDRPTATAKLVTKGLDTNLEWEICQFEPDLLGGQFVLTKFSLVVDGNPATQDFGKLTAFLDAASCTTAGLQFDVILESTNRVVATGTPSLSLADDWDGDGCSDWLELAFGAARVGIDPFNPNDCGLGPIGGIAELPEIADAPLNAVAESSGTSAVFVALAGAGLMAGALGLGVAAWYARRSRSG